MLEAVISGSRSQPGALQVSGDYNFHQLQATYASDKGQQEIYSKTSEGQQFGGSCFKTWMLVRKSSLLSMSYTERHIELN